MSSRLCSRPLALACVFTAAQTRLAFHTFLVIRATKVCQCGSLCISSRQVLTRPPGSVRGTRHHSRNPSWGSRLIHALSDGGHSLSESKGSIFPEERVWYDQFTSTDWVHDTIADSHRVKALRRRKDFWGRILVTLDGAQGWFLSALCGAIIALIAYSVDVAESTVFDFKDGFCARAWYLDEKVRAHTEHYTDTKTNIIPRNAVLVVHVKTGRAGRKPCITTLLVRSGLTSPSISSASCFSLLFLAGLHYGQRQSSLQHTALPPLTRTSEPNVPHNWPTTFRPMTAQVRIQSSQTRLRRTLP